MTTAPSPESARRRPVGAEVTARGVHFRVWAPRCRRVEVVLANGVEDLLPFALDAEDDGYFAKLIEAARPGTLYWYRLDGGTRLLPDPASRFQPDGPEGPSEVVDPAAFAWTDGDWRGVERTGQVIYEMHIGAFTPEGTWQSPRSRTAGAGRTRDHPPRGDAGRRFRRAVRLGLRRRRPVRPDPALRDAGRFPQPSSTPPTGLASASFSTSSTIISARPATILPEFSDQYFSKAHKTDWGEAINFDGPGSGPVREFFIANAAYWIEEFHIDGLRIDATQNIYDFDTSHEHILAAITRTARDAAGHRRCSSSPRTSRRT